MRQQLSEATDDFLRFRASQDLSKSTLQNDRTTLTAFMRVNGNIWVNGIDQRHVIRYKEEAAKTRVAASWRPAYSSLSQFFKWARHTKRMPLDSDPLFGMRPPKVARRERQRIHRSKFPALLDVAEEQSEWHRALTAVLLYTLLRESEVRDLRIRDVDLDGGWLRARITKSHKEDTMPITPKLDQELRRWLTIYTAEVGPLKPHYYLIPTRVSRAGKMADGRFGDHEYTLLPEKMAGKVAPRLKGILERMGVDCTEKGEGGHTIRRSGARALYDHLSEIGHPRPLRVVKDTLHHSTESVTEIYLGVEADRLDRDSVLRGDMYGLSTANVTSINRDIV